MIRKSFKYLIVAFVNSVILIVLLALWTDKLELLFNDFVRSKELLKIIGFSILSVIAMRILVSYFRNRDITKTSFKIKMAALLTLIISSYLYLDYSSKLISNVFINGQFRKQIANKIRPWDGLNATKGEKLTFKEYEAITKMYNFPKLPAEAENINYTYSYDGFLPDYSFELIYDLPQQMKVDTIKFEKGDFSRYQSVEIIGNKKRVSYNEYEQ